MKEIYIVLVYYLDWEFEGVFTSLERAKDHIEKRRDRIRVSDIWKYRIDDATGEFVKVGENYERI